jgi:hypothetical protein
MRFFSPVIAPETAKAIVPKISKTSKTHPQAIPPTKKERAKAMLWNALSVYLKDAPAPPDCFIGAAADPLLFRVPSKPSPFA